MKMFFLFLVCLGMLGCTTDMPNMTTPEAAKDAGMDVLPNDDADVADILGDTATQPVDCTQASLLCQNQVPITLRESANGTGWGDALRNQNATLYDWTNPDMVVAALSDQSPIYPPIPMWPDTAQYPDSYNVGDQLDWFVNELNWAPQSHEPQTIVIHHTAGEPQDSCFQYMQNTANFHTFGVGRGYGDIGYHFVVCQDNTGMHVYEGRWSGSTDPNRDPLSSALVVGAHSIPNTGAVGIALVGDFTVRDPSKDEWETLLALLAEVSYVFGIPAASVTSHRDRNATSCPGDIGNHLSEIRERIEYCTQCQ